MTLFNCGAGKNRQKQGRASVLHTLANLRKRSESVPLEHENCYTAPHSCEL